MDSNNNSTRGNHRGYTQDQSRQTDHGPEPYAVNIRRATLKNDNFRTTIWTGNHLQLTLMSIKAGEEIGLELHPDTDQFLRLEEGLGVIMMGSDRDRPDYQERVGSGDAILIPAGTWHNLINIGRVPLKLYSIYAPPHHHQGTVHRTKKEAEDAEKMHG